MTTTILTKLQVVKHLPKQFNVLIGQDLLSKARIVINCANKTIEIQRQEQVDMITSDEEETLEPSSESGSTTDLKSSEAERKTESESETEI